ncbi:unnamed protein product, partial [Laminaria digitata]
MFVRLDAFHGMTRITKLVSKAHGACLPFTAILRDAFFMVNRADVRASERVLANQGMTEAQIAAMKETNWTFFLRNARRRVPARLILLLRFNAVIKKYKDIRDAKTGEVLLSAAAMKAVRLVREHIKIGCFSDPEGVPLYFERGKSSSGLPYFRCVRGTNSTEGYHRYLRTLFANFCASPWVAHSVLMEFNHRWNISRAVANRGMAANIGGFSHQYMLDQIQGITAPWYPGRPVYSEWVAPMDFEDNGERTGLAASVLTFDGKPAEAAFEDWLQPGVVDDEGADRIDQRTPVQQLLPSARRLAALMNQKLPTTPVTTFAEKRKFKGEYFQYLRPGGASARDRQNVDCLRWAADWNAVCEVTEKGGKFLGINRKTASQLQSYAAVFSEHANLVNTMAPVQEISRRLVREMRQQAPAEIFSNSIAEPRMPAPDPSSRISLGSSVVAAGA